MYVKIHKVLLQCLISEQKELAYNYIWAEHIHKSEYESRYVVKKGMHLFGEGSRSRWLSGRGPQRGLLSTMPSLRYLALLPHQGSGGRRRLLGEKRERGDGRVKIYLRV